MRIKKGDKWKAVFLILEGVFKPTVIFFELTNSLVIFQAIINDLLRNIIEIGDVVMFIDNIMVETETKEEHNNIIEEMLRKMIENNLFVKLEKSIWKVREVGFLEVVIRLDKMKIEKEKVQEVVD